MTTATIEPGAVIDGFVIGERIHIGSMATLWQASRPDLSVPLVFKAPNIHSGDDATAIVGFEMEMMILPRLAGPHAPRVYGVGDFARQPYVAMEQIAGESLFKLLERMPLPPAEVVEIGVATATALVDLHRQNVLHLDIKPSNIMRRPTGEAVLIDYGLSRHLQLPDLLEEEFNVPMGTGPYISPEQVMRNRSDPRSDIFSLGVVLYHLATGVRPFGFPATNRGLRRRLWRDPTPPRAIAPDIPPYLQEIVLRCLEPDAELRYPKAEQLAFDLRNPDSVKLGPRAERMKRDGALTVLKRRIAWAGQFHPGQPQDRAAPIAPIVMAAIDLSDEMEPLAAPLREEAARVLAAHREARLACVNVLKQNRVGLNYPLDAEGRNIHVQRLIELKDWARPLGLDDDRITFHVLEHADEAHALLEYAGGNHVDHILIGAHGATGLRRLLGGIASRIVAEAPCTVTVVRARRAASV